MFSEKMKTMEMVFKGLKIFWRRRDYFFWLENQLPISHQADTFGAQGICKGSYHSDTDALTFGTPITLRVEPKDVPLSLPKLSILTSYGNTEKLHMCLAAHFSPKKGPLSLSIEGKDVPVDHSVDNAALSNDGTYYLAAFSKDAITSCRMNGETDHKSDGKSTTPTRYLNCTANDNMPLNNTSPRELELSGSPKGNTMLLIVTGLRLLLAKAVGLNILITIKAFLV